MQRNTGYFPTESLEPSGNRLFSRSALNEGDLFRGSLGFGGVRIRGGMLQITPALPNSWEKLSFFLWWHGCRIHVSAAHDRLVLENISGTKSVLVQVQDRIYTLDETLSIPLCNLN